MSLRADFPNGSVPILPRGVIMVPKNTSFARIALVSTLIILDLFLLSPSVVLAEPTFHKMKRRLHRLEHTSGIVLGQTSVLMLDGLIYIALDALLEHGDDDETPSLPAVH